MKTLRVSSVGVAIVAIIAVALIGCSAEEETNASSGMVTEMMDSVAAAVAENIIDSQISPVGPTERVELAVGSAAGDSGLPPVNDIYIKGSLAYAAFEGGVLIYDLQTDEYSVTPIDETFRVIAEHGGSLFAGGDELYEISGNELVPISEPVPGQITALCSFGPSLMIGSTDGLFARSVIGLTSMLEEVEITALASGDESVWIGTAGEGLYQYDGFAFRKRYLARDTSLFDNVTALAFSHNHLYLGTAAGMYIFDGGSWATVSADDGLPAAEVTDIDASGWVVYVATPAGLASYFNDEVLPVDRMGNLGVTSVARLGTRIIAGTISDGVVIKVGPAVRTLVEPWASDDGIAMDFN